MRRRLAGSRTGSATRVSDLGSIYPGRSSAGFYAPPVPDSTWRSRRRLLKSPNRWRRGGSGRCTRNTVKVLTVVGFAIPLGLYIALLAHYQVNAIWTDQWGDVHVLVENNGHFPNWSALWTLHGDNRVFFPNLVVITLAHTVSFNIEVEEFLSALMLFGATALLIWAHKRRSPATPLLFYVPVAFVMLTFAQSQNSLWGFQMAWYLVLLGLGR